MNTFPKVSVVTTTYNDIENLKRILAEVKKQTYPNIEHIIVDGGSTDGTVDLLKDLEEKDALFSDFKAVKEGNVWCTGKYLYQATDIVGELITDMNLMLTGGDESKMTFLYHVK